MEQLTKPQEADFYTEAQKAGQTLYAKRKSAAHGDYIEILYLQNDYATPLVNQMAVNFKPESHGENGATLVGAKALEAEAESRRLAKLSFRHAMKDYQNAIEEQGRYIFLSSVQAPHFPSRNDFPSQAAANEGFSLHADAMRDYAMEVYTGDAKLNAATALYMGDEFLRGYRLTLDSQELVPLRTNWEDKTIECLIINADGIPTGTRKLGFWDTLHLELRGNSWRYEWSDYTAYEKERYTLNLHGDNRMSVRIEFSQTRGLEYGWASSSYTLAETQEHIALLNDLMKRGEAWAAKFTS